MQKGCRVNYIYKKTEPLSIIQYRPNTWTFSATWCNASETKYNSTFVLLHHLRTEQTIIFTVHNQRLKR